MIYHAKGPQTSAVSKVQAEKELRDHPQFPKTAELEVWEQDGHWLAAWHDSSWRTAEFPPAKDEGGDEEEEAPSPKPEDGGGSEDSGPEPFGDDGGEGDEGPPKKDGEGSEKHEITQLLHLVTQMATALGIVPGPGAMEGPAPGAEGPMPPGPPGGPPHGPHGGPAAPDQTVQHQRALKPGEAPPGTTPVGAPAFASTVADTHPWKGMIGKAASFVVEHQIPENVTLSSVDLELQRLAYNTRCSELPEGFKVKQVGETRVEGQRVARALISAL